MAVAYSGDTLTGKPYTTLLDSTPGRSLSPAGSRMGEPVSYLPSEKGTRAKLAAGQILVWEM